MAFARRDACGVTMTGLGFVADLIIWEIWLHCLVWEILLDLGGGSLSDIRFLVEIMFHALLLQGVHLVTIRRVLEFRGPWCVLEFG